MAKFAVVLLGQDTVSVFPTEAESTPTTLELSVGNVWVVESVPAKVRVLLAVSVLPSATASVELVAGAVIAILLMLVTVGVDVPLIAVPPAA